MNKKILYFIYGLPNIVGSSLGIIGLLLFFVGLVKFNWYIIVPALYAAGVLATPNKRDYHFKLDREGDVGKIKISLQKIDEDIKGKVSPVIYNKVHSVIESIQWLLPILSDPKRSNSDMYTIKETALSYLPGTLENYLRLPRSYAQLHTQENGKTAKELFIEQLDLLDTEMKSIIDDVNQNNVDSLKAHSSFLKKRFAKSDVF